MIQSATVLTIVLIAASTYVTRALGYVLLRGRTFSPRVQAVLEAVPGCVLIAVIAPAFVSDRPADLIALALTVLAAMRWPERVLVFDDGTQAISENFEHSAVLRD